jgi:D-amino-acid dehydrogenase
MHVCVLGAGIAGLSAAWLLTEAGHQVTVIDRAPAGSGASGGNGAQLSYSYVQPLADPSIWNQLPKLLLSPRSPLKVRPQLDPQQWRWALQFMQACNAARSRTTTSRLLALAASSRAGFDAFRERYAIDCDFTATGKLVLFRSEAAFASARRQMALQQQLGGAPQQAVTALEAACIEPALEASLNSMVGAIYTPSECAADCRKVCHSLEKLLGRHGARLLRHEITGFEVRGDRIAAVRTGSGDIEADAFVLSLGAGSAAVARRVGVSLPLYPLKGYSITARVIDPGRAPKVNITDSARKVVFARIGRHLRVAGMAELVGHDASIPPDRIRTLADATEDLFPGSIARTELQPWTGMRPATPRGEPLVGLAPKGPRNLVLNTGHGALGFTLAFGTAQQVVQAIGAGADAPVATLHHQPA